MKKLLLTLLLAAISSNAMADWVKVIKDKEQTFTTYADPDTIRKIGNRVKMWVLSDYNTERKLVDAISTKQRGEYNCKEKKKRILFIVFYSGHMGQGETVLIHNERGMWRAAPPGSVSEAILKFACGFRPKLPQTFPNIAFS